MTMTLIRYSAMPVQMKSASPPSTLATIPNQVPLIRWPKAPSLLISSSVVKFMSLSRMPSTSMKSPATWSRPIALIGCPILSGVQSSFGPALIAVLYLTYSPSFSVMALSDRP